MTCREKLALELPEMINIIYRGGCKGCPADYGYLPHLYPGCEFDPGDRVDCTGCWNREIPDNENWVEVHVTNPEKPVIKDSGNRRQFESGAVRDMQEGKGRCDLMPLEVVGNIMGDPIILNLKIFLHTNDTTYLYTCLSTFAHVYDDGKIKASNEKIYEQRYCTMFLEVAKHFEEGAKKYGENNWQKGIPPKCYIDSAVRHYLKWLRGDKDEPHDRAFVWNLMCCIWEVDYREKEESE